MSGSKRPGKREREAFRKEREVRGQIAPRRGEMQALTPEDRMRVVWCDAMKELPDRLPTLPMPERDAMIEHGAAAIRAAVAEAERVQRSRIVAWLNRKPPHAGRDHHEGLAILADQIHEGEPEAWAARTGWRAP